MMESMQPNGGFRPSDTEGGCFVISVAAGRWDSVRGQRGTEVESRHEGCGEVAW